ncbi:flavodoxin family protein [Maridesulfovibrio sp.]|uniref:flavodoxin family protein n=1 Tax=unclassified Maridesulfovibrio TaxID=2794999 RepID=UPI003B00E69E
MILGIEGSPRKKGNSHKMLEAVLTGASKLAIATETVHLRDLKYEPCIGCEICRKEKACRRFEDDMTDLYPKLENAKGLVLISPVHNYNVTAWMKAFIDRLYCYYNFEDTRPRAWSSRLAGQGRKAIIGAVAEQEDKKDMGFTIEAMRMPLEALGYEIVEELPVLRLFDRGIIAEHQELIERAQNAGLKLAKAISGQ